MNKNKNKIGKARVSWKERKKYKKFKKNGGTDFAQFEPFQDFLHKNGQIVSSLPNKKGLKQYQDNTGVGVVLTSLKEHKGLIWRNKLYFSQFNEKQSSKVNKFKLEHKLKKLEDKKDQSYYDKKKHNILHKTKFINKHNYLLSKPFSSILFAGAGSGKTDSIILPTIIANINSKAKPSMVITDPKGEIYKEIAEYGISKQYDIKFINLKTDRDDEDYNDKEFNTDCLNPIFEIQIVIKKLVGFFKAIIVDNIKEFETMVRTNEDLGMKIFKLAKENWSEEEEKLGFECEINKKRFCWIFENIEHKEKFIKEYIKWSKKHTNDINNILHYRKKTNGKIQNITTFLFNVGKSLSSGKDFWDNTAKKVLEGSFWILIDNLIFDAMDRFLNESLTLDNIDEYLNHELIKINLTNIIKMSKDIGPEYIELFYKDRTKVWNYLFHFEPSDAIATLLQTLGDENIAGGARANLDSALQPFTQSILDNIMTFKTMDYLDIVKRPTLLFIVMDTSDTTTNLYIEWFLNNLINRLNKCADQNSEWSKNGKLNNPIMFILEELGNITTVKGIANLVNEGRGRNIFSLSCFQTLSQYENKYKESDYKSSCQYELYMANKETNLIEPLMRQCGQMKVRKIIRDVETINEVARITHNDMQKLQKGEVFILTKDDSRLAYKSYLMPFSFLDNKVESIFPKSNYQDFKRASPYINVFENLKDVFWNVFGSYEKEAEALKAMSKKEKSLAKTQEIEDNRRIIGEKREKTKEDNEKDLVDAKSKFGSMINEFIILVEPLCINNIINLNLINNVTQSKLRVIMSKIMVMLETILEHKYNILDFSQKSETWNKYLNNLNNFRIINQELVKNDKLENILEIIFGGKTNINNDENNDIEISNNDNDEFKNENASHLNGQSEIQEQVNVDDEGEEGEDYE